MLLVGWIWMLFWMVALLFGIWLIARRSNEASGEEDAIDVVRARYARGEISAEEFERACGAPRCVEPPER